MRPSGAKGVSISTSLVSATLLIAGCAAPAVRSDTDQFMLLGEGRIQPTSVQAFSDCVLDGFDRAHSQLANVTTRQQRRTDSYRIETLAGGRILLVSVDAFDDGRVGFNESKSAALVSTSGERMAFDQCLKEFAVQK